jgi:putative membrane protein
MLQLLIALLLGILAGTITGLIPGIHTNLIALILISSSAFILSFLSPIALIILITSMAITHTFVDFIPAIFLGAPDEDTALSIMPGHDLLIKGRGYEAILLTLIGSTIAIILLIPITPIFLIIIPKIYPFINRMMAWILIWTSIFLVSKEKNSKLWAILIFFMSGFLGLATLNLPVEQPLLPLLTGLFGSSTLIYSISKKTKIPEQKIGKLIIQRKELLKPTIATALVSPIASFLPGLGASQAAIIGSEIFPRQHKLDQKQFLILLGSINTLVMATSFTTLYLISKARTGTASAIQQITQITLSDLIAILITILIASAIAIIITIQISKYLAKHLPKINYTKVSLATLTLLTLITFLFSGPLGIAILATATLLGLTCIYSGIRRGFLMGALLIPTIIFYLPF